MADKSNPSTPDTVAPTAENPDNKPDAGREAPHRNDTDVRGRTYTVTGLIQAHVPPKSLVSYVKAG
jgi:hypothetical protein